LGTSQLRQRRPATSSASPGAPSRTGHRPASELLLGLQRQAGNRAVVNLLSASSSQTLQRGPGIKERMASLAKQGLSDPRASAALDNEKERAAKEEELTAKAFQSSTFYYGTTGGTGVLKKFLDTLTEKKKQLPYYWPGERAKQYIAHSSGKGAEPGSVPKALPAPGGPAPDIALNPSAQMMDMYYGMEGTSLHKLRNPQIGKYVHEKMGYKGAYDQARSGRDAYMETYSKGINAKTEGWQYPQAADSSGTAKRGPQNAIFHHPATGEALTGTMEISRYIRDGIFKYGGTLVFEGKFVYNEGNFVSGAYQGDTNKEAVALFPYLADHPGKSRVAFGQGTLVFQYGGQETVPTQWLFRQRWGFKKPALPKEEVAGLVPGDSIFWKFPEGEKEMSAAKGRWVKAAYDAVSARGQGKI